MRGLVSMATRPDDSQHDDFRALVGLVDHRLPFGVIGFDASGRVRSQNHAARAILRDRDGLLLYDHRLAATRPAESAELGRLVADACRNGANGAGGAVWISRRSPHPPLTVLVAPLRPHDGPDRHDAPAAVAFITDVARPVESWEQFLNRQYGLTPVETEVAMLFLRGASVGEIARRRGTTRNTVRTHMKRLLEKVGARCQADLVRVLLGAGPGRAVHPSLTEQRVV
jgi:DNA-binding CsgD family transcriptional regulator